MQQSQLLRCLGLTPGLGLCLTVTLCAYTLHSSLTPSLKGFTPDTLVLSILIGIIVRSSTFLNFTLFESGIRFTAQFLLELAVMLLGSSISIAILAKSGFLIIGAVMILVFTSIVVSYSIARLLRLSPRLALLIACGNAICGNSAIVAVASVIKAKSDEIAPAIAFTALLGVVVVVVLPFFMPLLSFSDHQYGVFAGMTVYAVPQVLAATLPVSAAASYSGTIVKLIRVLMLGPMIFIISLMIRNRENHQGRVSIKRLLPWFIIGFCLLMGLRSAQMIPYPLLNPLEQSAKFLTILSMAALGLGVDVRSLAKSGIRVITASTISLIFLGCGAALFCLFFL